MYYKHFKTVKIEFNLKPNNKQLQNNSQKKVFYKK